MKKVLIIGSAAADVHIYIDHLPAAEEDIIPRGQKMIPGGCAFNVSNAIKAAGVPYTLFCPVGTGVYGDFIRAALQEQGIRPAIETEEENGCCYCLVDRNGSRTFMSLHGAEYRFRKEWFESLNVQEYAMAYVCGLEIEEPCNDVIIDFLRVHPELNVLFAPGPRVGSIPKERLDAMLSLASAVHCNAREICALTGKEDAVKALASLPEGMEAVVTDGSRSVLYRENGMIREMPVVPVKQVNGTGAGDAHCGMYMAMRMRGMSMEDAVRKANLAGAAVAGSQSSVLTEKEAEGIL